MPIFEYLEEVVNGLETGWGRSRGLNTPKGFYELEEVSFGCFVALQGDEKCLKKQVG